ncbi:MAG: molybdate ABC transporter substrate-binding protein [Eubacterium sp.]|nr:molybdate ABC transporter substrate-binding protein [Eubacterium sp.]
MKKKSILILLFMMIGVVMAGGCGKSKKEDNSEKKEENVEIVVFAAASLTESLQQIGDNYSKEHPNVKITFNFDSSGTLKTQIEEGADCDLFISAAKKQMDALDVNAGDEKNPDKNDYIDVSTRKDLLENNVVLAVPADNKAGIHSFDDLVDHINKKDILLALGNEDVPVGQYTQKIFAYYNLDEKKLAGDGLISYGSNVKEVTTQVKEASVDCGVIYSTDASSAGLKVVAEATKDMCGQVIYPAAVLKNSKHKDVAADFLKYLSNDESVKIFEGIGFTCIK